MVQSTLIYRSVRDAVKVLSLEDRARFYDALLDYSFDGIEPDGLSPLVMAFYTMARPNVDCRNRRVEGGKLGGRPRKSEDKEEENLRLSEAKTLGYEKTKSKVEVEVEEEVEEKVKEKDVCAELADCEAIPLCDGTEWRPTRSQFDEYERLYPGVDVRQEIAHMRGWCNGNPTKRKTARGVSRFVNGWLSRKQDSAKAAKAQNKPKNAFNRFEQHSYDFKDIERRLLEG